MKIIGPRYQTRQVQMFGSQMIEVLIGLGFLFFLLSVIVTTVREFIEGLVHLRRAVQ